MVVLPKLIEIFNKLSLSNKLSVKTRSGSRKRFPLPFGGMRECCGLSWVRQRAISPEITASERHGGRTVENNDHAAADTHQRATQPGRHAA